MNEHNNDDISELLNEYKAQREKKNRREPEPLEPPKRREELIDFSKQEESVKEKKPRKKEKEKKSPEEIQVIKKKAFRIIKKAVLIILAVSVIISAVFGIKYGIDYSKTAYLKPYTEKYPDVDFPDGILEKYCDAYGQDPSIKGFIKIEDADIESSLVKTNIEKSEKGAEIYNYVVYLTDYSLEKCYGTAQGYNLSENVIEYSDLTHDYTFQVAGAFYTNTDKDDDDGYIFPYNVTEKMTFESTNKYLERVKNRLLYNVSGLELTRQDTLLTISCPTDYRNGYRFVVVCKAVDKINTTAIASEKENVRLTDIEYKEMGIENPYRFAEKWYPEIIVTDENGNESTIKKSIEDYE